MYDSLSLFKSVSLCIFLCLNVYDSSGLIRLVVDASSPPDWGAVEIKAEVEFKTDPGALIELVNIYYPAFAMSATGTAAEP